MRIISVGAGGLANSCLWGLSEGLIKSELANKPISIEVYDHDIVEASNLPRQIFYKETDCGKLKAELLSSRLQEKFKQLSYTSHCEKISKENIEELSNATLILDCCDSPNVKFLLNLFSKKNAIPMVYAGVIASRGLVFPVYDNEATPCLECLFGPISPENKAETASCRASGVHGPLAGYLGFLEAEIALQLLLEKNKAPKQTRIDSQLLEVSLNKLQPKSTKVSKEQNCSICSEK